MTLLALCYPVIAQADYEWIQRIRRQHDAQFRLVAPHFTLVFPTADYAVQRFSDHIRGQLHGQAPITIDMRCALVVKDGLSELTHTFLVPDQGFSDLVRLHDRLYRGILAEQLRLDVPFIPHITVATSPDADVCKRIADEINQEFERARLAIRGVIRAVDIAQFAKQKVTTLEQIALVA